MAATLHRFALAAALVLAVVAPGRADDILRVGKASPTAIAMMPLEVGLHEGIFKKHGIDLKIIDFEGGGKMHQGMAAGSIDIGVGAGPEMAFVAKGSPELAVANVAGPPLFIGIMVAWNSPIHAVDQLKGKKIGVSSQNSMTYWMALELARHEGWGPEGVTPVTIGGQFAAVIAAFKTHEIDAEISSTANAFELELKKEGRLLIPVSDYLGNMGADMIFASDRIIHANPGAVRRFLVAWFETVDFMRHHHAESIKVIAGVTGLNPEVQKREFDQSMPMFNEDGRFDKQSLDNLERSFTTLKLLDHTPDMSKLYTEAFLPKH
ncbi:MAG TPA: ABC transporter substrate-binding protein [Stellaceae bacterium]|nr:ABC transporter substrate-binding protein [Stellaceae bacterium]